MDRGLLVGIGPAPDKKIGLVMIVYSNERSKRNKIKGNYFVTFSSNNRSLGSGEAVLSPEQFMKVQRELNMKKFIMPRITPRINCSRLQRKRTCLTGFSLPSILNLAYLRREDRLFVPK